MKHRIFLFITIIFCLFGCSEKKVSEQYNVIYIIANDLGLGDLGCYGQSKIPTPNIDKLAKEGMLFTQHYAGSTISIPSQSALLTGLHTGHTQLMRNNDTELRVEPEQQYQIPANSFTLAKMFKNAGYVTGAFGIWGLGEPKSDGDPTKQGFDEFYGYNISIKHQYPTQLWHNSEKIVFAKNMENNKTPYGQDIIQRKALEFIRKNVNSNFFAYLPYILPHTEILEPDDSNLVDFAAMVTRLDSYVGEVIALVDSLGIRNKTIIVFSSSNSPDNRGISDSDFFQSSGRFRGAKRDLYEGGIRVPMIVSCPTIVASGVKTDHISAFWDVLPTFAEMIGAKIKSEVDGISFFPTLKGTNNDQKKHDYLYWEYHEQGGKVAVRKGNWKAVKRNILSDPMAAIELYDLSKDIHEDNNVAGSNAEIVADMEQIMKNESIDCKDVTL